MEEEKQKYAEYKAEYVRRQSSSHSSENEDPRSDPGVGRPVHHERQPALYGDPEGGRPLSEGGRSGRPDQYLYSPQQKKRVPHEQLPATREQHVPEMSRFPPNSFVQYRSSGGGQSPTKTQDYSPYQQQPPVSTSRSRPYEPDNRHKYIREYEIPSDSTPTKPKQEFVLRWGPHQKSPSVERVIGRHTPDREGSRFGAQEKRSHRRTASDGYSHAEGGISDRHRSPSTERNERYSSPDKSGQPRTYQMPRSSRGPPVSSQAGPSGPGPSAAVRQLWHYNQTYEDQDGDIKSPELHGVTNTHADVLSPFDTLKSTSSSGHSAPVKPMVQVRCWGFFVRYGA